MTVNLRVVNVSTGEILSS
ncbi:CsgG/HfaB family protein [Shigella flexneri]